MTFVYVGVRLRGLNIQVKGDPRKGERAFVFGRQANLMCERHRVQVSGGGVVVLIRLETPEMAASASEDVGLLGKHFQETVEPQAVDFVVGCLRLVLRHDLVEHEFLHRGT